jgi:uncharacterized membrane protein (UPF0127 family)
MEVITARGLRRLTGLIGRRERALLIPRCRSVHTFGMRFPLDLVWLGAGGEVVRVDRAVPPWRVRSCRRARSVLELPAGIEGDGIGRRAASGGEFCSLCGRNSPFDRMTGA